MNGYYGNSAQTKKSQKPYRYYSRFCIALPWCFLLFVHLFRWPFHPRTVERRRTKSGPISLLQQSGPISLLQLLDENHNINFESRPIIYSFYDEKDNSDDILSSIVKELEQKSALRVWAELWAEAGWNPTLLTIEEAKKHTDFKKYEELLKVAGVKESHRSVYFRYLAMSIVGGGWLAKLNVLPLYHADEISNTYLPNGGGFTTQDILNPTSFLSGNEKEWSRIARTLIENLKENEISSMDFLSHYKSYYIEDSVLRSNDLAKVDFGPNLCENTNMRVVRYNFGQMGQNASDQLDHSVLAWVDSRKSRCQSNVSWDKQNELSSNYFFPKQNFTDKHIPLVMIIGAQKAATTLIFEMLQKHPMIAHDEVKEKRYFNNPWQKSWTDHKLKDKYSSISFEKFKETLTRKSYYKLFPEPDGFHLTVDATPEYMIWTHILPQIQEISPTAKIIVSLRDPVERLYSQYCMYRHKEVVKGSFEEFIEKDIELLQRAGLLPNKEKVTNPDEAWKKLIDEMKFPGRLNVARGLYSVQLREWFRYFPRESFLILKYDDLDVIGEKVINDKIISFLGLPKNNIEFDRHVFPGNYEGVPVMKTTTRKMLYNLYKPYNEELSSLLGMEWEGVWQLQD